MKNIHEVQKQSAPCPSKQVRFSAFVDKIGFEALEISADESTSGQERGGKSQLWYQRYEYQRFKLASLQLCRGARQEHGNCFEQTFCQGPMSPSNMVFKDLASKFPYLRGLEQWVSLRYGRERENQRRKTIYSVLKTQQNFRLTSRTGTPPGNDVFLQTRLAEISQLNSEGAKAMALLLGNADEYVASQLDEEMAIDQNHGLANNKILGENAAPEKHGRQALDYCFPSPRTTVEEYE